MRLDRASAASSGGRGCHSNGCDRGPAPNTNGRGRRARGRRRRTCEGLLSYRGVIRKGPKGLSSRFVLPTNLPGRRHLDVHRVALPLGRPVASKLSCHVYCGRLIPTSGSTASRWTRRDVLAARSRHRLEGSRRGPRWPAPAEELHLRRGRGACRRASSPVRELPRERHCAVLSQSCRCRRLEPRNP